ncbi:MAG: hypothetical protein GWM90_16530, partial [Gemmatimonadetes bacterium]|nr:hypothetical protein [Gemmatimonadota bacterium]NIQ55884.1 hypothetical protein [Gemmatimonadota bacterium]NIU76086.1 hypothetical protein [Gammaproteobacteria bacterium]NIX45644.1 hypothetical protein [Gemmatimonadota bacterium]NIY09937.1 hypothetical protein [Gemmatimonadota bacterium]
MALAFLGSADPTDSAPLEAEAVGPLVGTDADGEAIRFRRGTEEWVVA